MERLLNVTRGEFVDTDYSDMPREKRREMIRDFCRLMNSEHKPGSAHVLEFHDGQPQRYKVVSG